MKFKFLMLFAACTAVFAQGPPPPEFDPQRLDQLVARVALYPDPLLAQVLAAATYPDQIADAANWADQHHYLSGQPLADAIQADQLPWDPSVRALLPFPSVLDTMAMDTDWTRDLGNAFLANQGSVMDAVQRSRKEAASYGYLRTNGQVTVTNGPYIAITPVNPNYIVVPYYDPAIVFVAPRRGLYVGGAIRFGYGVTIGAYFRPWGWGLTSFNWGPRVLVVNGSPWGRNWVNRRTYVHPYTLRRFDSPRSPEHHSVFQRSPNERREEHEGQRQREEHHAPRGREEHRDKR